MKNTSKFINSSLNYKKNAVGYMVLPYMIAGVVHSAFICCVLPTAIIYDIYRSGKYQTIKVNKHLNKMIKKA